MIRFRADADTSHPNAEEMWESLGWHTDWYGAHHGGQVAHPICTVEQLDTLTDEQILQAVEESCSCAEERDAYERAIIYARSSLDAMRGVESCLDAAVTAYEAGDVDACRAEGEYGDDPATTDLRDQLLDAFIATHEITLTDCRDGERRTFEVSLVDGAAYTEQEWNGGTIADWEYSDEDGWTFQGRSTPADYLSVSVQTIFWALSAADGDES